MIGQTAVQGYHRVQWTLQTSGTLEGRPDVFSPPAGKMAQLFCLFQPRKNRMKNVPPNTLLVTQIMKASTSTTILPTLHPVSQSQLKDL